MGEVDLCVTTKPQWLVCIYLMQTATGLEADRHWKADIQFVVTSVL